MTPDLQAKVDEIREWHAGNREAAAHDRNSDGMRVVGLVTWYDDIDTLLDAIDAANQRAEDAERVEREATVAWLKGEARAWQDDADNAASRHDWDRAGTSCNRARALRDAADAIARGEHREGRDNDASV